jgi:serine/threonine-protein phosphatase 2B catalytic subunit
MHIPTDEQFFARGSQNQKPDIAMLKNHFYREGRLSEEHALWILETTTAILRSESNVLQVDAPITGVASNPLPCSYTYLKIFSLRGYPWSICTFILIGLLNIPYS